MRFVMSGCREVLVTFAGSVHIERQVELIEKSITGSPRLAFEACKALLETTCKTLLRERGVEVDGSWTAPKLLKQTLDKLDFLPETHRDNTSVKEGLKKTLNGLQTVMQGLAEIRNSEGLISHGPHAAEPSLDAIHALMAARAVDAVVHFLFGCHRAYPGTGKQAAAHYEASSEFNEHVDTLHDVVEIFESRFRPSEVLFELDKISYDAQLREFHASKAQAAGA